MRITSSSHSVARCERLRAARDGLSVPWCEEPGAARARGQVSRGELRRSVVTMMVMPRSLHRCCGRERQREHCRRTWQSHLCVMEVLPSMDTKRENSSEFFHFTPQLSRGRPRSGFTHPSRAAMRESGQLCVSLLPPGGASDAISVGRSAESRATKNETAMRQRTIDSASAAGRSKALMVGS